MRKAKEVELAEKKFKEAHNAWAKVNKPEGYESGDFYRRWEERISALLELVRIKNTRGIDP
ncbi:hypothetical protein KC851_02820 [Candidatus Kaiserbacteria bacterium]|nr:hypothetical protein [Candidatus Kaiserbacteria bacterium]